MTVLRTMSETAERVTRRVRISTGLDCNTRCPFCYYGDELNTQRYSADDIRLMLRRAREFGIEAIDFSGGEPTVRHDLPDLVAYARGLGFARVCVITNGVRLGSPKVIQALVDAGLNEVLLSIHGIDGEVADAMYGRRAMQGYLLRALEAVREHGLRLRTNTVVTRINVDALEDIAGAIARFRPAVANFICLNDWVNAAPATPQLSVRLSEAAPRLMAAIDVLRPHAGRVNVRYIPFCLMPGYEEHVCGLLSNTFDEDEWLDSIKRVVTDIDAPDRHAAYTRRLNDHCRALPERLTAGLSLVERRALDALDGADPFDAITPDNALAAHVVDNALVRATYAKSEACVRCAFDAVCDGVHKSYAAEVGTEEFVPITTEDER